jgi:hypothetical protein
MRFSSPVDKQGEDNGLRTRRQIDLYLERERALKARAERRATEAWVRHLNFDLVQRAVLLVIGVLIGAAVMVGALGDPGLLKLTLAAVSAWGGVAAILYRAKTSRSGDR